MSRLYVVVHGLRPSRPHWEQFCKWLQSTTGDQVEFWDHNLGPFSRGDILQWSMALRAQINEWDIQATHNGTPYKEIFLIGHSMGGILVRDAYLLAADSTYGDDQTYDWHKKIKRIVLLASINRGIVPSRRLLFVITIRLLQFFNLYKHFTISHLTEGSNFITNLRLRWINRFSPSNTGLPQIVQILGTKDGVVSPADSIDLEQFPNAHQVQVPDETHAEVYFLKNEGRKALFQKYIVDDLPSRELKPEQQANKDVNTVVILLHGIHASRDGWVKDAADLIRQHPQGKSVEIKEYSYGFFAPLAFVIPSLRHNRITWFQNLYSEARGKHPNATFHFIGHSNGTYMFGHGLANIAAIKFSRVALAGCALPREFDWETCFERGQIQKAQNHRSRSDFVIAWLASAISFFGKDVGTAGYFGFDKTPSNMSDYFFYPGGHSRPYQSDNLKYVVDFILDGKERPLNADPKVERNHPYYFEILSRVFKLLLPGILALDLFALYTAFQSGVTIWHKILLLVHILIISALYFL